MSVRHIYSSKKISFFYSTEDSRNSVINLPDIKTEVTIYKDYEFFHRCVMHTDINNKLFCKPQLSSSNDFNEYETLEQKELYEYFKESFINDDFIDLEEYSFLAVTLLYDLISEYKIHKNIDKLEKQLIIISQCYPNTKDGALNTLGSKVTAKRKVLVQYNNFWSIGSRFRDVLKLSQYEVDILDILHAPNNQFCRIDYCLTEVVKLYLILIRELEKIFFLESTTFLDQINLLAEISLTDNEKMRDLRHLETTRLLEEAKIFDSETIGYSRPYLQSKKSEMSNKIFDSCENSVREFYGHKEMIDIERYFTAIKLEDFEAKIMNKVKNILPNLLYTVRPPDESAEFQLNSINHSRWRTKYSNLKANFNGRENFVENIISLAISNLHNPNVKNIFFDSTIFIANYNRNAALTLYVYYIYFNIRSSKIENRPIPAYIQKLIFENEEQTSKYKLMILNLEKSNDFKGAIIDIHKFYIPKRRYISLEKDIIIETEEKHMETVTLLNEILGENMDVQLSESNFPSSSPIDNKVIKVIPCGKKYVNGLYLAKIQIELLNLFAENNFILSIKAIEKYAKEKSVFKNALIESINDIFFEVVDDSLIEELDENYVISQGNFNKILYNS